MAAKCKVCLKSVYPMDPQINLDGTKLHKACAKCGDCGCQITISNFTKNESNDQTVLLCKIHYFKRFHEGGSYLGGEKFRVMSTRDMKPVSLPPNTEASSTQQVEESQSSVQALKTVFNVTKTETVAPAAAAPIPDIKETEAESEIVPNETEDSTASADDDGNDNSVDAATSESPVPDAEEEVAAEVEDSQE
eukprot:gene14350-16486_t